MRYPVTLRGQRRSLLAASGRGRYRRRRTTWFPIHGGSGLDFRDLDSIEGRIRFSWPTGRAVRQRKGPSMIRSPFGGAEHHATRGAHARARQAEPGRRGPRGRRLPGRTGGPGRCPGVGGAGVALVDRRPDRLPDLRRVLRGQRGDGQVQLQQERADVGRPVQRHHQLDLPRRQRRPGGRRLGRNLRHRRDGQPGPESHRRPVAPGLPGTAGQRGGGRRRPAGTAVAVPEDREPAAVGDRARCSRRGACCWPRAEAEAVGR